MMASRTFLPSHGTASQVQRLFSPNPLPCAREPWNRMSLTVFVTFVVAPAIVTYGPGPNKGVVDAFTTAGDLLGSFTSRSRAAAEIANQVGVCSHEDPKTARNCC